MAAKQPKTVATYIHTTPPTNDTAVTEVDLRPGRYYVSARDGSRHALLLGPFARHELALAAVSLGRACAHQHDPIHAPWCAYGTCRLNDDYERTPLGVYNLVPIAVAAELEIDYEATNYIRH